MKIGEIGPIGFFLLMLSGLDLAEVINDSFSKISSDIQPLEHSPVPVDHTPDEFIITLVAVERSLLAVREGKSPGPDDIPNWLLKDFAPVISHPICRGSVESDLRPISLTAVLSKVLEGFVFSWLCPIVMPQSIPSVWRDQRFVHLPRFGASYSRVVASG